MKAFLILSLICLCNVNAFFYPTIDAKDAKAQQKLQTTAATPYEVVSGIITGYLQQLGLGTPQDVIYCYDESAALFTYDYYYVGAIVSANANYKTVISATAKFWAEFGNRRYNQMTESVLECIRNSQDTQDITSVLGVVPDSREFSEKWVSGLVNNTKAYQLTQAAILAGINSGDFKSAGAALAAYHQLIFGVEPKASQNTVKKITY